LSYRNAKAPELEQHFYWRCVFGAKLIRQAFIFSENIYSNFANNAACKILHELVVHLFFGKYQ